MTSHLLSIILQDFKKTSIHILIKRYICAETCIKKYDNIIMIINVFISQQNVDMKQYKYWNCISATSNKI